MGGSRRANRPSDVLLTSVAHVRHPEGVERSGADGLLALEPDFVGHLDLQWVLAVVSSVVDPETPATSVDITPVAAVVAKPGTDDPA